MSCKKSWIVAFFALFLAAFAVSALHAAEGEYKGPAALAATKDGSKIFVVHADADEIAVLDVATDKIAKTFPVGKRPHGAALSPDEKTLYVVSGAYVGKIQALDAATGKVLKESVGGHTPMGPVVSPDGIKLYTCDRFDGKVTEYALPGLERTRRFQTIREPRAAVITPDGKRLYVLNGLPCDVANFPENEDALIDVAAEITTIDTASGEVKNIRLPNGSGSLLGICITPDGRYVYLTEILARFQMPTTQVERGWMNTNGISIIDTTKFDEPGGGFVNTVLIDDVDKGAANPYGITTSVDGKEIYIAVAGTNELIIVDAPAMHAKLDAMPKDDGEFQSGTGGTASTASGVPNDLAFLVGMKTRVAVDGKGARPIAAIGDKVYLGMYFSDTLQKVDLKAPGNLKGTAIPLGPEPQWTSVRRGEIYWNDASLCFQLWQSCASCHPDARMDAYNWDLLNDGMGNPKNAKSLLFCHECPPAMWEGVRASSQVCTRTGFQHILFTVPDEEKCLDIDDYVASLRPEMSPWLVDGKLSEKAERGKKIFEDPKVGCAVCHPAPMYTDQKVHDVNTKCYYDRKGSFDTPSLQECWRTAPYLHDGRYINMFDLFKQGKHGDVQGDVDSLTDQQIEDLVEYVLSL